MKDSDKSKHRTRTRLVSLGRDSAMSQGFVNIPPFRGSTVLFPDARTLRSRKQKFTYGTHGTPTTHALSEAWSELSGAAGTVLVPSGLAAVAIALQTAVSAGDHLLIVDAVYSPTRDYADQILGRFGVETTYYDPTLGAGVADLFRPNTRAIFLESPGSLTLEVQDVRAIAEVAHRHGACVILDNTWATPLFFPPHVHGVDLAVDAGTKYLSGHSDLLIGAVSANAEWFARLHKCCDLMAIPPGPEDAYLALRGMRTMELRLREQEKQALILARWVQARPEVLRVIHPALPDHPQHALWKRDFAGSSGLFSVVLKPVRQEAVDALVDGLELFGIGYSWGGYESLITTFNAAASRTATKTEAGGPALRLSIGLEDVEDLKDDLDRGFARLRAAM
jgi:cysteine-S-conjugate beta-lyase